MVGKIDSYVIISRALVDKRLTPLDFETVFLSVFRGEGDQFDPNTAGAIQKLFDAVDAYCDDPDIRDENTLDEDGLLQAVLEFLSIVDSAK